LTQSERISLVKSVNYANFHAALLITQVLISELLQNTFILKKSYSSSKFVHYFEWGSKNIHFFDVDKMESKKVNLKNDFNIPKFCRTVVTDEGRVFCIGGRHQDNVCCDWMMEFVDAK